MPRSVYRVCGAESGADTPLPSLIHVQFRARLAECASNHHLNGRRDLVCGCDVTRMARLTGCTEGVRECTATRTVSRHRSPSLRVRSVSPRRNDSRHVTRTTRRRYGEITALTRHPTTTRAYYRTRSAVRRSAASGRRRRVSRTAVFRGSWPEPGLHPRGLRGSSSGPDRTLGQRQRHAAPATRSAAQRATAAPQPNVKTKLERVLLPVDLHLGTPHAVRRSRV